MAADYQPETYCMLNDKVTVVASPARRMGRAWALESARGIRLRLARSALAAAVASLLPLYAAAQAGQGAAPAIEVADTVRDFDLPAGRLAAALEAFSTQSGIRLDLQPGLLADRQARAVSGRMDWREALGQLLQGSGLEYRQTGDTTVVIATAGDGTASADEPTRARPETTTPQAATTLEAVTVTGTRIRGGTSPSPVITIGSERIQEEGFTDLGEVIRSVPQNFGGGQNPGVVSATGSGNIYNQNVGGASSLNLRGLGADATLTLLNGRRLAYGGFAQAVDISAIPVEAVERVEIVADGASAIYGSDAVGGVGNVILKRDFDGVTVGFRHGAATDGGLTTREYNATAGAAWDNGGLIATYKDVSIDPVHAAQRAYTEYMEAPFVIYPGSELRSGLLSAHQSLGESVELRLDALRTEREQKSWYQNYSSFYYDNSNDTTTSLVSPSAEIFLPGDWSLSIGGSWGKSEGISDSLMVTTATGASTVARYSCYCNESRSYEVSAEGPLFALRGGAARLAIGVGYRTNDFLDENYLSAARQGGDESSRFAYTEINLPLISAESGIAGLQRLALTAAVRSEAYGSFGNVTTPKVGLIYGPSTDFTLKASWGRSFKAPMLAERYGSRVTYLWAASDTGGIGYAPDATVLMSWGGNPELDPERARTVTASMAFHPEAVPGLEAELTWFDIDYRERIVLPLTVYSQSLSNPALAEFIVYSPTLEQLQGLISANSSGFYNLSGMDYDPNNVVAMAHGQYANAMRQRIKGIDLSGSYGFELGNGRLMLRGSASWLDSSQQNSAGQSAFDLAGTLFYPAKLRSRIGAVYTEGGFVASAFANHADGVTDRVTEEKTSSFTVFDATLRFNIGERGNAWSGVEIALSAHNLFDRAPPLYTPTAITSVPYDSTNYSAVGRFLSASVSKSW